jgi:hypothetical protein
MKRAPEEKLGQRTPYRIYLTPTHPECQVHSNKNWSFWGEIFDNHTNIAADIDKEPAA